VKMRRLLVEVLVPEGISDTTVGSAIGCGLSDSCEDIDWHDCLVLRGNQIVEFSDVEWAKLKESHGFIKSTFNVAGTQTGRIACKARG
jgi:hypothetical protein